MTARVRPYVWDLGKPTATPGALIHTATRSVFIPASDMRRIADALHDHADQLEGDQ